MNIFVSGKVGEEQSIRTVMDFLRSHGHHVTFDWTAIPHLKPYEENPVLSAKAAELEIKGVQSADVVIVLAHERGVGLFVELGAALALGKPVIVKSQHPAPTMFLFHPLVRMVSSDQELMVEFGRIGSQTLQET